MTSSDVWDEDAAERYDETSAAMFAPDVLGPTVELLARLADDGPALELAVGTGRVAVPLVERGVPVTGIELSRPMVERLRAKASAAELPVVVGVSGPGLLVRDDLRAMHRDPIVFALANPDPEILPEDAAGLAAVIATGRSDYPNQINNVLCFPGIFRGALDAGATTITEGMKLAAAEAIADAVPDSELSPDWIVPSVFNRQVVELVATGVAKAAAEEGVLRS